MKRALKFFGGCILAFLLLMPVRSFAENRQAGNYFVRLYSYNGETIVSSPLESDLPISREAEISTKYDAEDHGFHFSCTSNSIYSSKFVHQEGIIQSCTVVNELSENVPFELIDTSDDKAVYLIKPDAGSYTITIIGRWTSGSISGEASLVVTFVVEKGDLSDFIDVAPYDGVYDASYHDAMTVTVNNDIGTYILEYKKPGNEYDSVLPKIKNVSASGQYYCKIYSDSPNFSTSQFEEAIDVAIRKKNVNVSMQDKAKCVGEDDPELECDIVGLAGYDLLSGLTITRESGETPGEYLISAALDSSANPNYSVTLQMGIFTIRQHDWLDASYSWNVELSAVTASRTCKYNSEHKESETVETTMTETEPTCTEPGRKEYRTAAFANPAFNEQTKTIITTAALGHDWNNPVYSWSADNLSVTASRTCNHDTNHVEEETVSVSSRITTPATCTGMGKTTYTSDSFFNEGFNVQEKTVQDVPATGHDWDSPEYTWNDDYSKVTAARTCLNDSSHTETETVGTEIYETAEPSCVTDGYILYRSAEFGNASFDVQQNRKVIPAVGHIKVVDEEGLEASCTEEGYTEISHCSVCEAVLSEKQIVPAKGHTVIIDEVAVSPTCLEAGSTEASHCSECGEVISEKKFIPAKGHSIVIDPYVAPTYNTDGKTEGSHCSVCGTVIKEQKTIARYSQKSLNLYLTDNYEIDLPRGSVPYNLSSWTESKSYYYLPEHSGYFSICRYDGHKSTDFLAKMFTETGSVVFQNPYRSVSFNEIDCVMAVEKSSNAVIISCGFSLDTSYYIVVSYSEQDAIALGIPTIIADSIRRYDVSYLWSENYKSLTAIKSYPYYDNTEWPKSLSETVQAHIINEFGSANQQGKLIAVSESFEEPCFSAQEKEVTFPVIYIPESTSIIQEQAFCENGCKAVIINDGCKRIESKAFKNCQYLEYVYIPQSVVYIAADAFEGCLDAVIDMQE